MREFSKFDFKDAREFLIRLKTVEPLIASSNLSENQKDLRTHLLRPHKHQREAALFCCGMQQHLGINEMEVACVERSDFDAVIRWEHKGERIFTPVQLKEVVPKKLNPKTTLEGEIAKLRMYITSPDLVVAILICQSGPFDFKSVEVPALPIGQLFVFGSASPDGLKWFVIGDLLRKPKLSYFDYPGPTN
jgi:hypothetical protein